MKTIDMHKDKPYGKILVFTILCLLALLSAPVFAAVIKATPDRDPVRMDETFNLVFSSEESVDDDPDFGPLGKDFDIIGQNQGSQMSFINGKLSKKQEWTLTLSPKHPGPIQIPPVAFGRDRSLPVSVTVLDSGAASPSSPGGTGEDAEIKLEVEAAPKNPYVQAQVFLTVRVLLRVNLAGADLSEPVVQDALVERLADDHRYGTVRNGLDYTVIERKFAIFPQKSGLLRIDPMHLTAQVDVGSRSFFSRSTRAVRVKSDGIDLKVRPIPPEFTGKHWLPAADLKLEETWSSSPPQTKAGEPLTRTLTLHAAGATVGVLPEMGGGIHLDPAIKQYPDQPVLNEEKLPSTGISSFRQEKTALIPSKGGKFAMPAVEIPWWNTKSERMEIARVPEVALDVEASGEAVAQPPVLASVPQIGEGTAALQSAEKTVTPAKPIESAWFWLALFFGSGWLATGLAWWRYARKVPSSVPVEPQQERSLNGSKCRKALQQACSKNDPAAARCALLDWANLRWAGRSPSSLTEVGELGGEALAYEVERINRVLYAHGGEAWQGDALWKAVEEIDGRKEKNQQGRTELEPMYR